jgi:hypothetical protein
VGHPRNTRLAKLPQVVSSLRVSPARKQNGRLRATRQVSTALLGVYTAIYAEQLVEDKLFPKNAPGAEFGLFGAVISTGQKLILIQRAGGVIQGGNVTREEFDVRGRTYRVDVENLRGHNLRFFGVPGLQD